MLSKEVNYAQEKERYSNGKGPLVFCRPGDSAFDRDCGFRVIHPSSDEEGISDEYRGGGGVE